MFISEKNKKNLLRSLIIYLGITAFIAVFGVVYEHFGHGVVSLAMYLAFLYPLTLGCLVYLALWLIKTKYMPSFLIQNIYNFGVAMLTCGSIFRGVVEIYGTPRETMCIAYVIIGSIFAGLAFLIFAINLLLKHFAKDKLEKKEIE